MALELQIDEANRSRVALERLLTEERSRGAADRARLAALGARIEQLEQSRGTGPRVVQENRTLHTELEAQSQQIEVLRQQVQLLRDGHMAEPQLKEENLRLRRDLEHSRAMLSRYTDELATIMPGMQKVIHKFQCDLQPGRSGEVLDIVEDCVAAEGTSAQMRHHPPPPPECFSERRPCPSAPASASPARRASHPESQERLCSKVPTSSQAAATISAKDRRAGSPGAGPGSGASARTAAGPASEAGRLSGCLSRLADESMAVQRRSAGNVGQQQMRVSRRTPSPVQRKAGLCSVAEEPPRWRF